MVGVSVTTAGRRLQSWVVLEKESWFRGGTSFVGLSCLLCLVFVMPLYASVYLCLVVTCWERADLLALVCGV